MNNILLIRSQVYSFNVNTEHHFDGESYFALANAACLTNKAHIWFFNLGS